MKETQTFDYDVFLSYNSKEVKPVVALAERLKRDGIRVWLDRWAIRSGDLIPLKVQQGVQGSRVLVLCMSPVYFESEWGKLEHHAVLFRDPTNAQRRLIPLLMKECKPPDVIAQFKHIDWRDQSPEAYAELRAATQPDDRTNARMASIRSGLMDRMEDIDEVYMEIVNRLNRIERQGIDDTDEEVLNVLEAFVAGKVRKSGLLAFWRKLSQSPTSAAPTVDLSARARALRAGKVSLFLGQDLPAQYGTGIPPARDLPSCVAALAGGYQGFGNSLSEVCEYIALQPDKSRGDLRDALMGVTRPAPDRLAASVQLFDLLTGLDQPFLAFASGYDCLLEQHLRGTDRPFVVISPPSRRDEAPGLVLEFHSEQRRDTERVSADKLSDYRLMEGGVGGAPRYSLIYRLRGQVFSDRPDTLLLTEGDYLDFARSLGLLLPNYLKTKLSDQQLWFLGHNPHAWEDRLLAKALLEDRDVNAPVAVAVQGDADAFARLFWRQNRVDYQDGIGLTDFVAGLRDAS